MYVNWGFFGQDIILYTFIPVYLRATFSNVISVVFSTLFSFI